MIPIPVTDGIQTLATLLRSSATQVAVLRMDPTSLERPTRRCRRPARRPGGRRRPERHDNLLDALVRADNDERQRQLESYLREHAAGKLGLAASQLDVESPLHQLGVDSLVAVELRAQIERDLGVVVPVVRLLDGPSVTGLAGWLADQLSGGAAEPSPVRRPTTRQSST